MLGGSPFVVLNCVRGKTVDELGQFTQGFILFWRTTSLRYVLSVTGQRATLDTATGDDVCARTPAAGAAFCFACFPVSCAPEKGGVFVSKSVKRRCAVMREGPRRHVGIRRAICRSASEERLRASAERQITRIRPIAEEEARSAQCVPAEAACRASSRGALERRFAAAGFRGSRRRSADQITMTMTALRRPVRLSAPRVAIRGPLDVPQAAMARHGACSPSAISLTRPRADLGCGKGLTCKLIAELTGLRARGST